MSDDLISRQAAIDAIEHRLAEPAYQHEGEDWYTGMNCAESELYDLPSAQPELIRCKDCKWKQGAECVRFADVRPFPSDFCSRAERREE